MERLREDVFGPDVCHLAQFFWSYFLMGIDACVSRLYEIDHYERLLRESGFGDVTVIPGPVELIVATKKER
ncbi:hypothetical protein [Rhizohabitans arisaemae]|uniref:hypothetical protein n=1 Tax=Rhizohabitans arisaemae TaxID=2720610 RepID=UPI0024B0D4C3|nr:hypothetical protein [Rhizohabitans arisaemae]